MALRARLVKDYPKEPDGGMAGQEAFRHAMLGELEPVYSDMLNSIRARTTSEGVRGGFYLHQMATSEGLELGVGNAHPLFGILEDGTRPHFIPPHWVPIAPLIEWAGDTDFAYAVQWKIAREGMMHPGTAGNHVVAETFNEYRPNLEQAVGEGIHAYFMDVFGGRV